MGVARLRDLFRPCSHNNIVVAKFLQFGYVNIINLFIGFNDFILYIIKDYRRTAKGRIATSFDDSSDKSSL